MIEFLLNNHNSINETDKIIEIVYDDYINTQF